MVTIATHSEVDFLGLTDYSEGKFDHCLGTGVLILSYAHILLALAALPRPTGCKGDFISGRYWYSSVKHHSLPWMLSCNLLPIGYP